VNPEQIKAVFEFAARSLDFSPVPAAAETVVADARPL
jgi:hypothetical protein